MFFIVRCEGKDSDMWFILILGDVESGDSIGIDAVCTHFVGRKEHSHFLVRVVEQNGSEYMMFMGERCARSRFGSFIEDLVFEDEVDVGVRQKRKQVSVFFCFSCLF